MQEKQVRGNPKDFAVLTGDMLLDYRGTFKVSRAVSQESASAEVELAEKELLDLKGRITELFFKMKALQEEERAQAVKMEALKEQAQLASHGPHFIHKRDLRKWIKQADFFWNQGVGMRRSVTLPKAG